MIRLIVFIFILGGLSLAANWLLVNDGEISAEWLGYRLETSVSFLIISFTVLLIIAVLLLQIFIWLVTMPERIIHKIEVRNLNRGINYLTEGFIALSTGDIKSAKRNSGKTKYYLGHEQPLSLMLEAQIGESEGNKELVQKNYNLLLKNKTTSLIGLKGLLGEAKKSGDISTAIEITEREYNIGKNRTKLQPILIELYKRSGKWDKALVLLESNGAKKIFNYFSPDWEKINLEKSRLYLMYARSLYEDEKTEMALTMARRAFSLDLKFTSAVLVIKKAAAKLSKPNIAISAIKKSWRIAPTHQLAESYMEIFHNENTEKRLKMAEKLASLNPNHVESRYLIAEAAIEAGQFAKAKSHIEMAMVGGKFSRACNLMAKIEELSGDGDKDLVNEWRDKARKGIPDPTWICKECNHHDEEWNIICSNCGGLESYEWKEEGSNKNAIAKLGFLGSK